MTKTGVVSSLSQAPSRPAVQGISDPLVVEQAEPRVVARGRARNASTASRAAAVSFAGTATSTVTSRSPGCRPCAATPLPLTRKVRPLEVPGGILSVTGAPVRVGTLTSPPRAASAKRDRHRQGEVVAGAPEQRCGATAR